MARFFLTIVVICGIIAFAWYAYQRGALSGITPIGSYTAPVSNTYTYQQTSADTIFVVSPKPGDGSTEHVVVNGFARGPWFSSDGTFPVTVTSADGVLIGSGNARAGGVWTVSTLVPFVADFTLTGIYSGQAVVVLKPGASTSVSGASLSFPILLQ
jgi:hypothetical protein